MYVWLQYTQRTINQQSTTWRLFLILIALKIALERFPPTAERLTGPHFGFTVKVSQGHIPNMQEVRTLQSVNDVTKVLFPLSFTLLHYTDVRQRKSGC